MKYVADDGTEFKTEVECVAYENTIASPSDRLGWLVGARIETEYNDDAGFSVITEQNVVDFIESNFNEIYEILGSTKEDSDGWISNIGRDSCGHPDSLSHDTQIEVKYRSGFKTTGSASQWDVSWCESFYRDSYDIVAYRILKD